MAKLLKFLILERCPHCQIDKPTLRQTANVETKSFDGDNRRFWIWYFCERCGGMVTAASYQDGGDVNYLSPRPTEVDAEIPEPARAYLTQAVQSLHAPAGAVMLAASSVDAMLKDKGYLEGSLYARINQAAEDHLLTEDMAEWAHEVRLDANDQRHADQGATLPSGAEAQRCIEFVRALGEFLYVLPERVRRGREEATPAPGG